MKNKLIKLLVCVFLGYLGIHKFMEKKIGLGIAYLLTGGFAGIGWIYDIFSILIDLIKTAKEERKDNLIAQSYSNVITDNKLDIERETAVIEAKKIITEMDEAELYLNSFDNINSYDLSKDLEESFIKSITRVREVDFERYMKFGGTNNKTDSFVVFDLETTGLSENTAEIIQLGAIKFVDGSPVEQFKTYIKPKNKIQPKITKINGITNDMVEECPSVEYVLPRFLDFIGDNVLIAHNASFDMKFLLKNLYDNGYRKPGNKVLCTLMMARQKVREFDFEREYGRKLSSYKLEELKYSFNLYELTSHEALADCKVCAYVYLKIQNANGDICFVD